MIKTLPDIDYSKSKTNPTVVSEASLFELPFYKDSDTLYSWEIFASFIKSVESMVRTNILYKNYIRYLKSTVGLTFCQVLSNIEDEFAEIEMHHGPIFTLFDYCSIMVEDYLYRNKKINTFIIADQILKEHFDHNIQIVMLSKTVHEQVHENNVFLNIRHGFGDVNKFITKYRHGITPRMVEKFNRYLEISEKHQSFDNNMLEISDSIQKYGQVDYT